MYHGHQNASKGADCSYAVRGPQGAQPLDQVRRAVACWWGCCVTRSAVAQTPYHARNDCHEGTLMTLDRRAGDGEYKESSVYLSKVYTEGPPQKGFGIFNQGKRVLEKPCYLKKYLFPSPSWRG